MKKMLAAILTIAITLSGVCVFAESFGDISFPDGWGNIDMPQMPDIDTSSFGEFTMPEGWGDMSLDGFTSPLNGEGWGNMDMGSDWGASFEEMKRQMETQFGTNMEKNKDDSTGKTDTFIELENAFNQQKQSLGNDESSEKDLKNIFVDRFGSNVVTPADEGIPPLDGAQSLLEHGSLETPSSSLVSGASSILNLNRINSFVNNTASQINTNMSFNDLSLPNMGETIHMIDMHAAYSAIAGSLKPRMDPTRKYDGSLFGSLE